MMGAGPMPYRVEVLTAEQVAERDPFGGCGVKLPLAPGTTSEQAERFVREAFGQAPFTAFGHCVWVDIRAFPPEMSAEIMRAIWDKRLPSCRVSG